MSSNLWGPSGSSRLSGNESAPATSERGGGPKYFGMVSSSDSYTFIRARQTGDSEISRKIEQLCDSALASMQRKALDMGGTRVGGVSISHSITSTNEDQLTCTVLAFGYALGD